MTEPIKLPPPTELYFNSNGGREPIRIYGYTEEQVLAAIEADRQARGEPVTWEFRRNGYWVRTSVPEMHKQMGRLVRPLYTTPQPQQIPEGYKQSLRGFLAALDKAHHLEKSTSAWVYRTQGSFIERQKAWAEVTRLRAMLEAAPEPKGQP